MVKNVLIVFGGQSTEHDISILSALQVLGAINKQKYNVYPIYISKSGKWFYSKDFIDSQVFKNFDEKRYKQVFVKPSSSTLYYDSVVSRKVCKVDCAIVVMHGKNGEDGVIQGVFESAKIPYTSGGVLSLASSLNKACMKEIFAANDFPIVNHVVLKSIEQAAGVDFNYPVVVKPNSLGSSIGIAVCKNKKELFAALDVAFKFDSCVIVEDMVKNLIEYNCAAYGFNEKVVVSKIERPFGKDEILSFKDKYLSKGKMSKSASKRQIPACISDELKSQIEDLTIKAFKCFNCAGVIRCDFMYDGQTLYINEINSIPGSLAFYLFDKPFSRLIDNLIEIAIIKFENENKLLTTFRSSVL